MLVSSPQAAEQVQPMQACMIGSCCLHTAPSADSVTNNCRSRHLWGNQGGEGLHPAHMEVRSKMKLCRASG